MLGSTTLSVVASGCWSNRCVGGCEEGADNAVGGGGSGGSNADRASACASDDEDAATNDVDDEDDEEDNGNGDDDGRGSKDKAKVERGVVSIHLLLLSSVLFPVLDPRRRRGLRAGLAQCTEARRAVDAMCSKPSNRLTWAGERRTGRSRRPKQHGQQGGVEGEWQKRIGERDQSGR